MVLPERCECYERWWKGKYLSDGRRIIKIKWIGPPSGVYGTVWLKLDDDSETPVIGSPHSFRPRKSDLEVFDEKPK